MPDIWFKKSGMRLCAILLVLICIPLFSLSIGNGLVIQDTHTENTNQDTISTSSVGEDALRSMAHKNLMVEFFLNGIDYSPKMQPLLNGKNNSRIAVFYELPYSIFFRTTPSFISISSQISVCIAKYFLITPYSPNAPPCILA